MTRHVLIAGGTGLVGRTLIAELSHRQDVGLCSLVRRARLPIDRQADFEAMTAAPERVVTALVPEGCNVAICCLGTTLSAAGSKEAMFRVDHDYVAAFAKGALAAGARHLILMSAAGAGGPGFYLQTKGAIEKTVAGIGFERVDLLRPGLILGEREGRSLPAAIGAAIYPVFYPLMIGPFYKYRGLPVATLASAISRLVDAKQAGTFAHLNDDLRAIARGLSR